jgi:hypothetical protein
MLLTQNAKLKKTSLENNTKIFNFSISAYKTSKGKLVCPFAKECIKFCYAQKGNYKRFPNVFKSLEKKYNISRGANFVELMSKEVKRKKANYIRIHDSGDFYSKEYLNKWLTIAKENKSVIFYAYTKSVSFFNGLQLPKNVKIIFSEGGKLDKTIDTSKHRHARIFKGVNALNDLIASGYINASNNDLNAITNNKKVGLIYH